MMVSSISVVKSQGSYDECECDHPGFEKTIMNYIDSKQRETGQYKW